MTPVVPQARELEPYLERLRALPFIKNLEVRLPTTQADQQKDFDLLLRTSKGRHHLAVELKHVPLTKSFAERLVASASRRPKQSWIAFSPYVPQPVGQLLAEHGIGFVDRTGNCHITLGDEYLVHYEGRPRPQEVRQGRGLGARSYQVLFALLARPDLLEAPIRQVADAAGVRKTTAAELLQRLRDEGLILRDKAGQRIARPNVLLDRWLAGYSDKLRPRLLLGRYHTSLRDPLDFEKYVEQTLGQQQWAWGGNAAAYRLTHHYRSDQTVLHVLDEATFVPRHLNLLPAKDGSILALRAPSRLSIEGPTPHVAHPLLVYTELLVEGDERSREAAEEVRSRYLEAIG